MKLKLKGLIFYNCDRKSFRDPRCTSDTFLFHLFIWIPSAIFTRSSYAQKFSTTHIVKGIDGEDIEILCNLCNLVLRPGWYVVIIMHLFMYEK